ncbi:MAG TPA: DinB family protein [Fimbriimonadaceae bacterium]|jgi:uncharacterized damage-inducible protein DinB
MADRDTLIKLADMAWATMRESIEGLTQELAWASLELQPGEYLHSEGSILSQIAHVANGKIIYGSVGFRDTEVRWRELSPKIDSIWPNLDELVKWLYEAHDYWMSSWAEVEDFDAERPRFDGTLYPGWKLIATVIQHDAYHAGQIHMQRAILAPSSTPPPLEGDLWEKYCKDFPCW